MIRFLAANKYRYLILIFVGVITVRLITLGALAILDPSEGRYAVIGQSMLLSGNFATPYTFEDGASVPFLAKPILHSWLTASSFLILGINEFAARFPSFLASVVITYSLFSFLKNRLGTVVALNSLLILASSALFFIMSGACLVDVSLTLGTVLIGIGFGRLTFSDGNHRLSGHIMFIGAAIGFLSKGPIALVLAGGPIFLWIITTKNWSVLKRIPWISGIILFLGLTAPWFIIAERLNPGFCGYFFVHENFLRFISSKYGDRYGSGHRHPFGAIWLMYLAAFLPWSLVWIKALIFKRSSLRLYNDHFIRYLLFSALFPAAFFTVAKQTSIYYVLPGLPWMAALTALLIPKVLADIRTDILKLLQVIVIWLAAIISVVLIVYGLYTGTNTWWLFIASIIVISLIKVSTKLLVHFDEEPHDLEGYPRRFKAMTGDERERISSNLIAACSLGSIMVLAVFTSALSALISSQESTRELVDRLKSNPGFQAQSPVFLRKIPHSAYFYSRLGMTMSQDLSSPKHPLNLESIIENQEELQAANPRFVVGTKKDVKKMGLIEKGWVSMETIGPWSIFEDVNRSSEN